QLLGTRDQAPCQTRRVALLARLFEVSAYVDRLTFAAHTGRQLGANHSVAARRVEADQRLAHAMVAALSVEAVDRVDAVRRAAAGLANVASAGQSGVAFAIKAGLTGHRQWATGRAEAGGVRAADHDVRSLRDAGLVRSR